METMHTAGEELAQATEQTREVLDAEAQRLKEGLDNEAQRISRNVKKVAKKFPKTLEIPYGNTLQKNMVFCH